MEVQKNFQSALAIALQPLKDELAPYGFYDKIIQAATEPKTFLESIEDAYIQLNQALPVLDNIYDQVVEAFNNTGSDANNQLYKEQYYAIREQNYRKYLSDRGISTLDKDDQFGAVVADYDVDVGVHAQLIIGLMDIHDSLITIVEDTMKKFGIETEDVEDHVSKYKSRAIDPIIKESPEESSEELAALERINNIREKYVNALKEIDNETDNTKKQEKLSNLLEDLEIQLNHMAKNQELPINQSKEFQALQSSLSELSVHFVDPFPDLKEGCEEEYKLLLSILNGNNLSDASNILLQIVSAHYKEVKEGRGGQRVSNLVRMVEECKIAIEKIKNKQVNSVIELLHNNPPIPEFKEDLSVGVNTKPSVNQAGNSKTQGQNVLPPEVLPFKLDDIDLGPDNLLTEDTRQLLMKSGYAAIIKHSVLFIDKLLKNQIGDDKLNLNGLKAIKEDAEGLLQAFNKNEDQKQTPLSDKKPLLLYGLDLESILIRISKEKNIFRNKDQQDLDSKNYKKIASMNAFLLCMSYNLNFPAMWDHKGGDDEEFIKENEERNDFRDVPFGVIHFLQHLCLKFSSFDREDINRAFPSLAYDATIVTAEYHGEGKKLSTEESIALFKRLHGVMLDTLAKIIDVEKEFDMQGLAAHNIDILPIMKFGRFLMEAITSNISKLEKVSNAIEGKKDGPSFSQTALNNKDIAGFNNRGLDIIIVLTDTLLDVNKKIGESSIQDIFEKFSKATKLEDRESILAFMYNAVKDLKDYIIYASNDPSYQALVPEKSKRDVDELLKDIELCMETEAIKSGQDKSNKTANTSLDEASKRRTVDTNRGFSGLTEFLQKLNEIEATRRLPRADVYTVEPNLIDAIKGSSFIKDYALAKNKTAFLDNAIDEFAKKAKCFNSDPAQARAITLHNIRNFGLGNFFMTSKAGVNKQVDAVLQPLFDKNKSLEKLPEIFATRGKSHVNFTFGTSGKIMRSSLNDIYDIILEVEHNGLLLASSPLLSKEIFDNYIQKSMLAVKSMGQMFTKEHPRDSGWIDKNLARLNRLNQLGKVAYDKNTPKEVRDQLASEMQFLMRDVGHNISDRRNNVVTQYFKARRNARVALLIAFSVFTIVLAIVLIGMAVYAQQETNKLKASAASSFEDIKNPLDPKKPLVDLSDVRETAKSDIYKAINDYKAKMDLWSKNASAEWKTIIEGYTPNSNLKDIFFKEADGTQTNIMATSNSESFWRVMTNLGSLVYADGTSVSPENIILHPAGKFILSNFGTVVNRYINVKVGDTAAPMLAQVAGLGGIVQIAEKGLYGIIGSLAATSLATGVGLAFKAKSVYDDTSFEKIVAMPDNKISKYEKTRNDRLNLSPLRDTGFALNDYADNQIDDSYHSSPIKKNMNTDDLISPSNDVEIASILNSSAKNSLKMMANVLDINNPELKYSPSVSHSSVEQSNNTEMSSFSWQSDNSIGQKSIGSVDSIPNFGRNNITSPSSGSMYSNDSIGQKSTGSGVNSTLPSSGSMYSNDSIGQKSTGSGVNSTSLSSSSVYSNDSMGQKSTGSGVNQTTQKVFNGNKFLRNNNRTLSSPVMPLKNQLSQQARKSFVAQHINADKTNSDIRR